ncbi:MAG: rRNA pseudouridine synthase [Erysipelotrichaceae bacterium]|nr:rRNA pseudouridine synthase [Erysipelotrichaceae bacterium]
MERLQKIIANSGICSRRKAEELIIAGKVKVNGVVVDTLGFKADPNDDIEVNGQKIAREEKVYFLINKPKNIISSVKDDRGRTTVIDLVDTDKRIFPVGRLDFDSSGLMLLTNDGELTNMMLHPSFEIEKTYEVTISGQITEEEVATLRKGVVIDGIKTSRAKVTLLRYNANKNISFLTVTIHEGRNRQVRKMFETLNYEVTRLNRIKEGPLTLGTLQPGQYRKLKPVEVKSLKKYLETK